MANDKQIDNIYYQYAKDRTNLELRNQIIVQNAQLVKYLASRMYVRLGGCVEKEDLESFGIFGLIQAVDKYEPSSGVKFETYASLRISGYMLDEVRKQDIATRGFRQMEKVYDAFCNKYIVEHGKSPEKQEIADALNISLEKLYTFESLRVRLGFVVSIDGYNENQNNNKGDPLPQGIDNIEIENLINDELSKNTPEKQMLRKEGKQVIQTLLDCLTENEKKVIGLYYFEGLTFNEISKILNLSPSRISQLHCRAIQKMKDKEPQGYKMITYFE